jgi:RNA polymerase sigma-70 factor (ECF subfamily)
MTPEEERINHSLGQFRAYLETLTFIQIDPRLRSKISLSDLIQNTLVEAFRGLDCLAALDGDAQRGWLRRALLNNLFEAVEHCGRHRRDFRLEQPLDAAARASSVRLRDWIAAEDAPPEERAMERERELRVIEALAKLPEREREALILQQYHGWKLTEIAEHLRCTAGAVAGLHARGLARLRKLLPEME